MDQIKEQNAISAPKHYIGVFILLIQSFLLVFITLRQDEISPEYPSVAILCIAAVVHLFEPTSWEHKNEYKTWAGVGTSFCHYKNECDKETPTQELFRLYVSACTYSIIITKFFLLFGWSSIGTLSPYKHCLMMFILFTCCV